MHIQPSPYSYSVGSSNIIQLMHPPVSTSSNNTIRLSQEHRTRLYQVVIELTDDQLRLFLTNHLQSISNTTLNNQFQHYSRTQLIQQSYILIDSYYSTDLEQTLYAIKQNRFISDYSQQQQQQVYRTQQQSNYPQTYNQQQYYYNNNNQQQQQPIQSNIQPNYRFSTPSNVSQHLRIIRPNTNSVQSTNTHNQNSRTQQQQQQQQQAYFTSVLPRQQYIRPTTIPSTTNGTSSTTSVLPSITRYQIPVLPPPPSSSLIRPIIPTVNILHKNLPFYNPLSCIYEYYQVFRFDTYRKQNIFRSDFLLSFDVCNQLSLSYDYDPDLDIHKTKKCLILRLVRIDQGPTLNGRYDDNLPPNLVIHINSQNLTNLPTPKPCTRQQTDVIRIGREIDITSYCMFNPILNNELLMTWSYRHDNKDLHIQYANAQYALHIFLVEHLAIEDLCEQIKNKNGRFYRDDLIKLVAKAIETDRDLGLEVSDQKLKLKCPIDQRRLKIPIRATTCQHLQCFDLTNYITLNEKAGKWICPVCNKSALFDDLQIDSYTESIINSIENENITEITIDSQLNWSPVTSSSSSLFIPEQQHIKSCMDDIILDDDQMDSQPEPIDTKYSVQSIPTSSSTNELSDVILIDD